MYIYIYYGADAENFGNSTASLRIWHLVLPALSTYLSYSQRVFVAELYEAERDRLHSCSQSPCEVIQPSDKQKNNQPLGSFPLWSFNTPKPMTDCELTSETKPLNPFMCQSPWALCYDGETSTSSSPQVPVRPRCWLNPLWQNLILGIAERKQTAADTLPYTPR